jgi:hypothetical protein
MDLSIDYSPVRSAGYRGDEKGNAVICEVPQVLNCPLITKTEFVQTG